MVDKIRTPDNQAPLPVLIPERMTPIRSWDPRHRIGSLCCLAVITSLQQSPRGILSGFALSLAIVLLSGMEVKRAFILARRVPLLMLPLILTLPLTSGGEAVFTAWKVVVYEQGLRLGAYITIKAVTAILLFSAAFAGGSTGENMAALKALGLPDKMAGILLLAYRYIFTYRADLSRMRDAMSLRGFDRRRGVFHWRTMANLAGSVLVRSLEQVERVNAAMVLRGYSGTFPSCARFESTAADWTRSGAIALIVLMLLLFL